MEQTTRSKDNALSGGRSMGSAATVTLPKGGGAIRGIGEKFAANPVTGTGSLTIPIPTPPGRSGFGPQLSLSYDSGTGNGPFGLGWTLSVPSITRKTDKGLPRYDDPNDSDVFILSATEDLVPEFERDALGNWVLTDGEHTIYEKARTVGGVAYTVRRYRPRVEGLFARIERWTRVDTREIHWRSITTDNVTTLYGKDAKSRIFDPSDPSPANPTRTFSWLMCESYDDKGNAILYEYVAEDSNGVDAGITNERNRVRTANRYLKRIKYGNRVPRTTQPDLSQVSWMFEAPPRSGDVAVRGPRPPRQGELMVPPSGSDPRILRDLEVAMAVAPRACLLASLPSSREGESECRSDGKPSRAQRRRGRTPCLSSGSAQPRRVRTGLFVKSRSA